LFSLTISCEKAPIRNGNWTETDGNWKVSISDTEVFLSKKILNEVNGKRILDSATYEIIDIKSRKDLSFLLVLKSKKKEEYTYILQKIIVNEKAEVFSYFYLPEIDIYECDSKQCIDKFVKDIFQIVEKGGSIPLMKKAFTKE